MTIEVTLSEDAPYTFTTSQGQTMHGSLPKGLALILPEEWIADTVIPKRLKVVQDLKLFIRMERPNE